jgi:predicted transcriptional regulator
MLAARVGRASSVTRKRRAHGDLEAQLLRLVWAAPEPVTPGEVLERADANVAYTTVMTVLTRLWEKGLLARERDGKAYRYRPAVTEAELTAGRMQRSLRSADDREAALSSFLETLSDAERATLRRLLQRRRRGGP